MNWPGNEAAPGDEVGMDWPGNEAGMDPPGDEVGMDWPGDEAGIAWSGRMGLGWIGPGMRPVKN